MTACCPAAFFPACVIAYIGPGAGFAFAGSALLLVVALAAATCSLLFLPARIAFRLAFHRGRPGTAWRRVVILGLDGLDPRRVLRLRESGRLPNLAKMSREGCFAPLRTTCPPISPVAWSSFATGVNPGKHGVFDFLHRDPRSYLPEFSIARIRARNTRLFGSSVRVECLRRSLPFWHHLGRQGIFSTVLRVPATFPPERFHGLCMAGLGIPDLRGTQGSFTCFEEGDGEVAREVEGGVMVPVRRDGNRVPGALAGPVRCSLPFTVTLPTGGWPATLAISGEVVPLAPGAWSDWATVSFGNGLRRIHGLCRFLLVSVSPRFRLYVTPIHVHPRKPALPISHPRLYARYLADLHGPFGTLGLVEDTWALNHGILSDRNFLEQAMSAHREREAIFLGAMGRMPAGLCVGVFDLADRVQHMFWQDGGEEGPCADDAEPGVRRASPIDDAYLEMDKLVGKTLEAAGEQGLVFVVSDHGFASFRRGVNLNAWLRQNGYLATMDGAANERHLRNVDWARTKAYALGLNGLYLNRRGRESRGVVEPGEAEALMADLTTGLTGLKDPATGEAAIHEVHDARKEYSGPYAGEGPDLVVGYADGFRASWESVVGTVAGEVFTANVRHWDGDHCIDPKLVPGVFLCSHPVKLDGREPHIMDIAPTVLRLFGINPPPYMDGAAMEVESGIATAGTTPATASEAAA